MRMVVMLKLVHRISITRDDPCFLINCHVRNQSKGRRCQCTTNITYLKGLNFNCKRSFLFLLTQMVSKMDHYKHLQSNDQGILRKATKSGYQIFEHDWSVIGPFYPRTFDLVNLFFREE